MKNENYMLPQQASPGQTLLKKLERIDSKLIIVCFIKGLKDEMSVPTQLAHPLIKELSIAR